MFSADELERKISSYVEGKASFDEFADWYRRASHGKFAASKELLGACQKVDAALSTFYFDDFSEETLRKELASAIRPFAPSLSTAKIRYRLLERSVKFPLAASAEIALPFAPTGVQTFLVARGSSVSVGIGSAAEQSKDTASAISPVQQQLAYVLR